MSNYTITINEMYKLGYELPLKDYPLFDEKYRDILNYKILETFRFREIGYDTIEMFLNKFQLELYSSMPYINNLYTAFYSLDNILLESKDIEKISNNANTSNSVTSNSKTNSDSDNVNVSSSTPKSKILISQLEMYADSVTQTQDKNSNSSTDTNYANGVSKNDGTRTNESYNMSIEKLASLTDRYFINIDKVLLDKLDNHFMCIY